MSAHLTSNGDWVAEAEGGAVTLRADAQRVIGLLHGPEGVSLVALASDQRTFLGLRQGKSDVLFVAPARVASAVLHATNRVLAVTTVDRTLLFYSLHWREMLARFDLERAE